MKVFTKTGNRKMKYQMIYQSPAIKPGISRHVPYIGQIGSRYSPDMFFLGDLLVMYIEGAGGRNNEACDFHLFGRETEIPILVARLVVNLLVSLFPHRYESRNVEITRKGDIYEFR